MSEPPVSCLPVAAASFFTGGLACLTLAYPSPLGTLPLTLLLSLLSLALAFEAGDARGVSMLLRWTGAIMGLTAGLVWIPVLLFFSK